jgi:hypothetical protein
MSTEVAAYEALTKKIARLYLSGELPEDEPVDAADPIFRELLILKS